MKRYCVLMMLSHFFVGPSFAQYTGGDYDGFGYGSLVQSTCPAIDPMYVYAGGNGDGNASGYLVQNSCPPIDESFVYLGGTSDGFSYGSLMQTNCPPIDESFVYKGGTNDGFGFGLLEQTPCSGVTSLMPVELFQWAANCDNQHIVLYWSTASELNNQYFVIEKSIDGLHWKTIHHTKGAGNSSHAIHYSYTDDESTTTVSYYRLKQIDFDGASQYSGIIAVACDDNTYEIRVYPNPSDGKFKIQGFGSVAVLTIFNSIGNPVLNRQMLNNESVVDLVNFAPGIYYGIIDNAQTRVIRKIIINR